MQFWFYVLVLCKKLCQQCHMYGHIPSFPSYFLLPFSPSLLSLLCSHIVQSSLLPTGFRFHSGVVNIKKKVSPNLLHSIYMDTFELFSCKLVWNWFTLAFFQAIIKYPDSVVGSQVVFFIIRVLTILNLLSLFEVI